ncbi:MAG TPA: class I SAM-dependent methyltransferase [Candidatus Limnocylindria bacterium]|nr:class I SAM-dependent methyltransferase [Candidatus Limnocylindria bacterium]
MTWDDAYRGQPPWEVGRPQRVVVGLEAQGAITGSVLDLGCGTGENALHLAERGHEVWGIDISAVAIERAMVKAHARRLPVVFLAADALEPEAVGRTFDTLIDSGCFHTLDDAERVRYAASVRALSEPGSRLHVMCFSEAEPPGWGPRRVTQAELRATFTDDWTVDGIEAVRFDTLLGPEGARAWLASFTRVDGSGRT